MRKRDIFKRALRGDKLEDIYISDCHCHMGQNNNFYFPKADVDEMMKDADAMCVDEIFVSPHLALSGNYRLGNKVMEEAIKKYPRRVYGYLVLNPNRPDEIDEEFEKYYKNPGFPAVKIHPTVHQYPITGVNYYKVIEKVAKCGGFILTHTWADNPYCTIAMCEQAIKDFPSVAIVLAHAGGLSKSVEEAIKVVNKYENAYLDTCGFEFSNIWIEYIAAKTDNKKILFGSDYPFHDLRPSLSRILLADLDDNLKKDILGNNFKALRVKYQK